MLDIICIATNIKIYSLPSNHPCPLPCHAPSSCPSVATDPCVVPVLISCPCGRVKQSVPCTSVRTQSLKCTNECAIAKRNARLAEALGISPKATANTSNPVEYSEELNLFGRRETRFLGVVEKTFDEQVLPCYMYSSTYLFSRFIKSDRKTQVLPHMPPERRQFVHDVSFVLNITSY